MAQTPATGLARGSAQERITTMRNILAVLMLVLAPGASAEQPPRGVVQLSDFATPDDGKDDSAGLLKAMAAGCVVELGPYEWDFFGQLLEGENDDFANCRIVGPVDESAAQHVEEGRKVDRYASRLMIHGLKPGQNWIDWRPSKFSDGKVDRGGPIGISNTVVQINGDGGFMRLGDPTNASPFGADTRKVDLTGLYVTLPDQLAHGHFDGKRLPAFAGEPVIEIIRGYDVTIHRVGIRGGGTQLRLVQCDRPSLRDLHLMWCFRGLVIDSLPGNAAVDAAVDNVFVEGPVGVGVDCESAQISHLRVEAGYDTKAGRVTIEIPWKIAAGGSRVELAGASKRLFAGQLVMVDGVWLRVVNVDGEGFTFDQAETHCYFGKAAEGKSIDACYGVGIIGRGDRFSLLQWSSDQNHDLPGLPIAAFVPDRSAMPIGPCAHGFNGWTDADNRCVMVGHCAGPQWHMGGSVDYQGTAMRPDSPLVGPGVAPGPDANWSALGIWSGNDEGRFLRFRKLDGRWVIRLDDSKTGRRMPPTREYEFRVYAHEPCVLGVWGGKERTEEHKLKAGWQTIKGRFSYEPTLLFLGSSPVSVELQSAVE